MSDEYILHPRFRFRQIDKNTFIIGCPQNVYITNQEGLIFLQEFAKPKRLGAICDLYRKEFLFSLKMGFLIKKEVANE